MLSRKTLAAAVVVVLSVSVVPGIPQDSPEFERTDYSGTWTPIGFASSGDIRIVQDDVQFAVTQLFGGTQTELVVPLDGSDGLNETADPSDATRQWTHVSRANWLNDDGALIVTTETTRESHGNSWEWMAVYTLNTDFETENLNVTTVQARQIFRVEGAPQYMSVETVSYTRQPQ